MKYLTIKGSLFDRIVGMIMCGWFVSMLQNPQTDLRMLAEVFILCFAMNQIAVSYQPKE